MILYFLRRQTLAASHDKRVPTTEYAPKDFKIAHRLAFCEFKLTYLIY